MLNNTYISPRKFMFLLMSIAFTIIAFGAMTSTFVYANDIPDNGEVAVAPSNPSGGSSQVKAGDLFGEAPIGPDNTGYADKVGGAFGVAVKFVINLLIQVFALLVPLHFAVDASMMFSPPLAKFFASKVPIQLFSNEAAALTGVKFTGGTKTSGSGGLGGAAAPVEGAAASGSIGGGNTKKGFLPKFRVYITERGVMTIIAGVLFVLIASGLLWKLVNFAIDIIIGLFVK